MIPPSSAGVHQVARRALGAFGALVLLTLLTVAVSSQHISTRAAIAVALSFAIVKATLVAAFFMHLFSERRIIRGALLLAAVLTAALLLMSVAGIPRF